MNCNRVKILLSAWLDSELDQSVVPIVEQHIHICYECRTSFEALKAYRNVAVQIDHLSAPYGLHERIMQSTVQQSDTVKKIAFRKPAFIILKAAGIAAIVFFALYLVVPARLYQPSQYEVDYNLQVKKMGKGPAISLGERTAGSVQLKDIMDLTNRCNGRVISDGFNESSGLTDYVTIRLRKDSVSAFRRQYNLNRRSDTLPLIPLTGLSKYVDIQIFFPGRRFVSCDINGDNFEDIIVYFRQGRLTGSWYAAINNKASGFDAPQRVIINDTLKYLPDQAAILSDDIDGDHYDDLIVQLRFGADEGKWLYYRNNRKGGFEKGILILIGGEEKSYSGINTPLIGDLNGDGLADIGAHYLKGENAGKWMISLGKGDGSFEQSNIMDARCEGVGGEKKYLPILMDYNSDGKDDCGVYWQWGDNYLCGRWFISINVGNNKFSVEKQILYAFCGEYVVLTGDFNGDGYDDVCTKMGTSDETGDWEIMLNNKTEKFIRVEQKITFGGEAEIVGK